MGACNSRSFTSIMDTLRSSTHVKNGHPLWEKQIQIGKRPSGFSNQNNGQYGDDEIDDAKPSDDIQIQDESCQIEKQLAQSAEKPLPKNIVEKPQTYPFCCIGMLISYFQDGAISWGTAVLVSKDKVLTCAHNVFKRTINQRSFKSQFYPAFKDKNGERYNVSFFNIPEQYYSPDESQSACYDYAILELNVDNQGLTSKYGYLGVNWNWNQEHMQVGICGYQEKENENKLKQKRQYIEKNRIITSFQQKKRRLLKYQIPTCLGQSGSPIFYRQNQNWFIVGIHTSSVCSSKKWLYNRGIKLQEGMVNQINKWVKEKKRKSLVINNENITSLVIARYEVEQYLKDLTNIAFFSKCSIGNQGFETLCNYELNELRKLQIHNNGISQILENLKSPLLQQLCLTHTKIIKIQQINHLQHLKSLRICHSQLSKIQGINKLTELTVLQLNCNKITRIEGIDKLKQLRTLSLIDNKIQIVTNLGGFKHIRDINLRKNNIKSLSGCEQINQSLKKLNLNNLANEELFQNLSSQKN